MINGLYQAKYRVRRGSQRMIGTVREATRKELWVFKMHLLGGDMRPAYGVRSKRPRKPHVRPIDSL